MDCVISVPGDASTNVVFLINGTLPPEFRFILDATAKIASTANVPRFVLLSNSPRAPGCISSNAGIAFFSSCLRISVACQYPSWFFPGLIISHTATSILLITVVNKHPCSKCRICIQVYSSSSSRSKHWCVCSQFLQLPTTKVNNSPNEQAFQDSVILWVPQWATLGLEVRYLHR